MNPALAHDFARRASPAALPERMDGETDYEAFRGTVASLAGVNRLTMGYEPLRVFLQDVLSDSALADPAQALRVLDVGSGYGDGARYAARYLSRRGQPAEVVGVDINPHAARAAREVTPAYDGATVRYVTADVFEHVEDAEPYDLVVSALFTHHLETPDVVRFLAWMERTAAIGWLVNDLARSRLAAVGFGALAALTGRHPHVRHDGPVSFARSFRRREWLAMLDEAGIEEARVRIDAPFRWSVSSHA